MGDGDNERKGGREPGGQGLVCYRGMMNCSDSGNEIRRSDKEISVMYRQILCIFEGRSHFIVPYRRLWKSGLIGKRID